MRLPTIRLQTCKTLFQVLCSKYQSINHSNKGKFMSITQTQEYFENLDTSTPEIMNHLGRLFAKDNNHLAIECAAVNFLTSTEEIQKSLLWWWNEGIRDYARDQDHVGELNEALMIEVRKVSQ